jgi:hypothetical protein
LGRLQQERATLEGAQAALKQREDEASKLNKALVQLSISHEDLHQSLEEQEAIVLVLRQEAEEARKALEVEKKQVEGGIFLPTLFFSFMVFRPADRLGTHNHPGRGCADGLQLLSTGVGRVVGRCP